jgi:soluble cytochrome b562
MYSLEQLTSNLTAFNMEQNLLAVADNEEINIYSQNNKLTKSISTDEGRIEKIYFIPDSAYLLVSTERGRVMLYNYKSVPFGFRLYSFVKQYKTQKQKKMTCAAFIHKRVAIAGSEGTIMILGLHSHELQQGFKPTYSTISAICFTNANKLVSAEVQGDIFIHTLDNSHPMQTIHTALYSIRQLLPIPNTDFILLHTGTNKLALLGYKDSKHVDLNYRSFQKDIAYIDLSEDGHLFVMFADKEIIEIQLHKPEEIESLILHNMITKAYQLVEKEPWLQYTHEYTALEKIYLKEYFKAMKALINEDENKAHQITDEYLLIESKKDDVVLLFKSFREYERLQLLIQEHKYAPAYALCEKFPPLKYTHEYKNMEENFKHAYILAQKAISSAKYSEAKEHLAPYLTVVSKQEMLNLILKYNRDFLDFLGYIKEEDYENINELLQKYPIFHEIPSYIALQKKIRTKLDEIRALINAGNIPQALKLIEELYTVPTLSFELDQLRINALGVEELLKNYEKNNFRRCYEILDEKNHIFSNLELGKLLEKHWKNLISKCQKYALKGDIKAIKSTLHELITVKTRSKQIGDILRLGFRTEIEKKLQKREYTTAEGFIYSYIDIFGIDKEIKQNMKQYEKSVRKKLAVTEQSIHRIPRDSWLHNKLIVGNY